MQFADGTHPELGIWKEGKLLRTHLGAPGTQVEYVRGHHPLNADEWAQTDDVEEIIQYLRSIKESAVTDEEYREYVRRGVAGELINDNGDVRVRTDGPMPPQYVGRPQELCGKNGCILPNHRRIPHSGACICA